MLEKILNCPGLPTFPAVATELLEMSRDPNVAMADIARLIKTDQGLASRVLKTVNSSFFGLGKPCTSIERALGYLGLKVIKSLVLGFSMIRMGRTVRKEGAFDMNEYWRRTICAAAGARQMASVTGSCDAEEAFTAGLFQDMGMLASYVALREKYEQVLTKARDHNSLPKQEQAILGFTHAEVGAALATKWRMSEIVATCVRFHHEPDKADPGSAKVVRAVAWGRMAADVLTATNPGQPLADLIVRSKDWYGWENGPIEELVDKVAEAAGELADIFEQKIGEIPDVQQLLAKANELLVEQQLQTQREAEQLEKKAIQLEKQTTTDALTGAANRKRFDQEIVRLFDESRQGGKSLAVLFVDADNFKSINDMHGHQAGDAVLIELARRMMRLMGQHGTVCRYGGEEFAIILPNARLDKAVRVGELVRKTIAERMFDLSHVKGASSSLAVTVSVGVSAMEPGQGPAAYESASQLVLDADKAVYMAKHGGRNCVRWVTFEGGPQSVGGQDPHCDGPMNPPQDRERLVLLVEPDPLAAQFLAHEFSRRHGVKIQTIATRAEAVGMIESGESVQCPDVLLCEFTLSDGDGLDVVKSAKAKWGQVTIFVLTGREPEQITSECLAAGAHRVYSKQKVVADVAGWATTLLTEINAEEVVAA